MRPYISIDIETAGLEIGSTILEIAIVVEDGSGSPVDKLPCYRIMPQFEHIMMANPTALRMNQALIEEREKDAGVPIESVLPQLQIMFEQIGRYARHWDELNDKPKPTNRIQVAGKNVASFDLPRLRHHFPPLADLFGKTLQHRTLDVGSMYAPRFGYTPSLQEILDDIGAGKLVAHNAVDDAKDVIRAIRAIEASGAGTH